MKKTLLIVILITGIINLTCSTDKQDDFMGFMTIYNNLDSSRGYAQISNNINPQLLADIINDCDEIWSISFAVQGKTGYLLKDPRFLMFRKEIDGKTHSILFKTDISTDIRLWEETFIELNQSLDLNFMDNHIWNDELGICSTKGEEKFKIINKIDFLFLITSKHYAKYGTGHPEKVVEFLKNIDKLIDLKNEPHLIKIN